MSKKITFTQQWLSEHQKTYHWVVVRAAKRGWQIRVVQK